MPGRWSWYCRSPQSCSHLCIPVPLLFIFTGGGKLAGAGHVRAAQQPHSEQPQRQNTVGHHGSEPALRSPPGARPACHSTERLLFPAAARGQTVSLRRAVGIFLPPKRLCSSEPSDSGGQQPLNKGKRGKKKVFLALSHFKWKPFLHRSSAAKQALWKAPKPPASQETQLFLSNRILGGGRSKA